LAAPFPDAWRTVLHRRWALWPTLSADEQARLEPLVQAFVYDRRWEAAQGFTLTEEVQVLVAAQACLLLLGMDLARGVDPFSRVHSVIVHRSTVVLQGQRSVGTTGGGLVSDGPYPVVGQAHHRGPVLLSWSTLAYEARHPARGQNVVMHEFAHQLDMLDGVIDGTPPIPDRDRRDRFVAVLAKAEPARTGAIRGRRHTMWDDSDINATRHARALVGGVLAGVVGDTQLFVSGGAEHQGPDGGGPVAAIARV
jgi:Mlc titration factor MtfA (ptsG expression regulator)